MLWWSVFFLIAAGAAGLVGFGEFVVGAKTIGRILFWIFFVLFFVSIILYTYTLPA